MKGKLFKIVGAVAIINIMARLIGFFREMVVGYQYGTSSLTDGITTAYTIPNFLYVAVGGAITTAFISVYSKLDDDKKKEFISQTFTYITVFAAALTGLLVMFADPIISSIFKGLDPNRYAIVRELYIWMAPSTFFLILSMWLTGILNVHNRFQLSTFATLVYNLAFLVLAVVFTPLLQVNSYGLGNLLGAILMVAMLIYGLRNDQVRQFKFDFRFSPEMKRLVLIGLPIMLGGAAMQFYFLIQRVYASGLPDGYVGALNYASKLTQFPQAVLMTAVTTVIYPLLARKVGEGSHHEVTALYQRGLRWLGLLLIPATIFVFFYAQELIMIIFQYGSFTSESTNITVPLLQIFSVSMFALAANLYISRFFYAMENSYTPLIISIICVFGVNILVIKLLIGTYGASAIALGTTISALANVILLIIFAKAMLKLKLLEGNAVLFGKTILLNIVLAVIMYAASTFMSIPNPWLSTAAGLTVFVVSLGILMALFRMPELHMVLGKLRKRA